MRYVVGFVCVLGALAALPLSATAQDAAEGTTPEPSQHEPAPSSEATQEEGGLSPRLRKRTLKNWDPQTYDLPTSRPSPEEPALQLELDSAGAGFTLIPASQPPKRGLDPRARAGIGLGVSLVAFGAGVGMGVAAAGASICISFGEPCSRPNWVAPVAISGALLAVGGIVGMGVSGSELRRRKPHPGGSRDVYYATPRRVQWDLARSRLMF
jgi:hypothetical protein